MKSFKQHIKELSVRDASGKIIRIKKQPVRGADMKMHMEYPGKSSSSGGGNGG